ncbi:MAG: metallophosphoesterase family protein [Saprospiraceae bacterium]
MRKIAFTDIHGCIASFEALLDQVKPGKTDQLFFLGDYIDRGPDSKAVLDKLLDLREKGYQLTCLMGNHDQELLISLDDLERREFWLERWGGDKTLESFGVRYPEDIPAEYLNFIRDLKWVHCEDDYILVHAGLNFYNEDPLEPDPDMLTLRSWYRTTDYEWLGNRKIIHGHTPKPREHIYELFLVLDDFRILDIDAGCYAVHLPGLGHLCAFDMTNKELYFQKNIDEMRWKVD